MSESHQHRAALYARVSTLDQAPENQLAELRRYVEAREVGRSPNLSIKASPAQRTDDRLSTGSSVTPSAVSSTSWSAGDWTDWDGISATSSFL